jgi:hypothetical protein
MEKENNGCCESKVCDNCSKGEEIKGCCHWKKCHMIKKVLWIVLLVIIFSLGVQMGEMKSYFHRENSYGCGMMGSNYQRGFKNIEIPTVDISVKTPETSVTPKQ